MAKDYEAAFEDVMSYIKADVRKVDSQRKLEQFLRQNDTRNVMSDVFIEKIARTNAAREIITEPDKQPVVARRARINRVRTQRQRQFLKKQGLKEVGSYTTKVKKDRFTTFINSAGKTVYFDDKNRVRTLDGRFSKR